MKKNILYIVIFLFVITGCADFLELAPPDRPSDETFWKTKEDFELGLTGCYGALQEERLSALLISYDCMTDNAHRGVGSGDYQNELYVTGLLNPAAEGHVSLIYS